ncbi:hypothetical protein BGZ65_003506 [Modicella reniformis]|uniref:Homologous-pairing protein 2 winged helix domain-containing protein n=1 Tax=Modicella reniformis TaxID=1440133 RepID=A0A9P6MHQ7_9FUNG|nr:hypothetical protein BGZ65_003506 [Modicella reniformis]
MHRTHAKRKGLIVLSFTHSRTHKKSEKLVLDYLTKQNRPYSVTDIVSNLHAAVSKAECQRIMNALVEKDLVTAKLYGKQAIYVVRQDTIDTVTPEELAAIDNEITMLQSQITESRIRHKQLSSGYTALPQASALKIEERIHCAQKSSFSFLFIPP